MILIRFLGFIYVLELQNSRVVDLVANLVLISGDFKSNIGVDVARSHGGDAGCDPLPDPTRIPSSCESGHGGGMGQELEKVRRKVGKPPLITFDPDTYKSLGKHGTWFTRLVRNTVTSKLPPYFLNWKSVPDQYKQLLYTNVNHYFDIARRPDYDHIIEAIDDNVIVKYRDRKTRRKTHFKKVYGGDKNFERALNNPHSGVNAEDWK
ncbi:uncharacterized protein LOC133792748 isoform X5 [Humulus lupulus]|uniref:uncharacterized protein LOC133792748 isoform X5 n=1 Tax=Humulus lupulus TaxID=3486 RepID=UPI002B4096F9|nr:uncharacterized protein LOC133792748 isoform X5 [Humulus lupulus]